MNDNNKNAIDVENLIHLKFNELMFKFTALQKKYVFVMDGVKFRANDIHLIDTIGRHPSANVTELAESLGVTKGAVSQKLKLLEDKGFILRTKDPSNAKEVLVELTEFGEYAYMKHEEYHDNRDSEIFQYMRSGSPENLKFLMEGLSVINGVMDKYLGEGHGLLTVDFSDKDHDVGVQLDHDSSDGK